MPFIFKHSASIGCDDDGMRPLRTLLRPMPILAFAAVVWFSWQASKMQPDHTVIATDETMDVCPEGSFRPEVIGCFFTREHVESRIDLPDPIQFLQETRHGG